MLKRLHIIHDSMTSLQRLHNVLSWKRQRT